MFLISKILFNFNKFILTNIFFRIKINEINNLSSKKRSFIAVANSLSKIDWLLIGLYMPKDTLIVINNESSTIFWAKLFKVKLNYQVIDYNNKYGLKKTINHIKSNKPCLIFPEGNISQNGNLSYIQTAAAAVILKCQVPVIPIHISGGEFSYYSKLKNIYSRKLFPKIKINIFNPRNILVPENINNLKQQREYIREKLHSILVEANYKSTNLEKTIFTKCLEAKKYIYKNKNIIDDINYKPIKYNQYIAASLVIGSKLSNKYKEQSKIGVMLPNSSAFNITFLGLQAMGKTTVLLNFSAGISNIILAVKTAPIKTIVSAKRFASRPEIKPIFNELENYCEINYLEDIRSNFSLFDKLKFIFSRINAKIVYRFIKPKLKINPDDPAVMLFTSGSENKPKGVVLTHKNLLANAAQIKALGVLESRDKIMSVLPTFHAFGLIAGVILPSFYGVETFQYPSPLDFRLVPLICYNVSATILVGTNTFLTKWMKYGEGYEFCKLRLVIVGAEKMQKDIYKYFNEVLAVKVFEGYGTTETSPVIALNTPIYNKIGTVGKVLPGINIKLSNFDKNIEGKELLLKGDNIMQGYVRHHNPGRIESQTSWYETGDIVNIDDQGFLTIIGRRKRFAKIKGEMVSLQQLEELIDQISPTNTNAAISVEENSSEHIYLYTTGDFSIKEVSNLVLKSNMPMIMVPKRIIKLTSIPLLATGKVDFPELKVLIGQ